MLLLARSMRALSEPDNPSLSIRNLARVPANDPSGSLVQVEARMKQSQVWLAIFGALVGINAGAQPVDKPLQLASREPAFYAIVGTHLERAEARNVAALRTRIALRLHNATIPEALKAIE